MGCGFSNQFRGTGSHIRKESWEESSHKSAGALCRPEVHIPFLAGPLRDLLLSSPLKKKTKKKAIFAYKLIIVPANLKSVLPAETWSC